MWNREPALVAGLVQAILALAVAFGMDLSPEQVAAVVATSSAVLGVVVRRSVSPVHHSSPVSLASATEVA